jgi:hypothetical protein
MGLWHQGEFIVIMISLTISLLVNIGRTRKGEGGEIFPQVGEREDFCWFTFYRDFIVLVVVINIMVYGFIYISNIFDVVWDWLGKL